MNTPEENEQQWQRVADAENPGMAELRRENERLLLASRYNSDVADQALSAMKDLQAEYNRRTDILNNHIARAKVLEDALDKASSVFRQVAECVLRSGGSVPKEDLMEIYRVCAEQALAAKEPTV